MSDELLFAVSSTSASLYTRRGRPLYATRSEWEVWSGSLPVASYVSAMVRPVNGPERLIFGALPLDEQTAKPPPNRKARRAAAKTAARQLNRQRKAAQ